MLLRITLGLALLAAISSFSLFALRLNIEQFLKQTIPAAMPDAFDELNSSIPIFGVFVSTTLLLNARIIMKRQFSLIIPLLFGPSACIAGWFLTENLNDPSWFYFFAITTIGMLVSCIVTALLSIAERKTTEQGDAHQALDRPF